MRLRIALSIAVLLLVSAPVGQAADPKMPSPEQASAAASNRFAIELYAHLRHRQGNLFFSPVSIRTCMAMAAVGARGETATQLHGVLGLETAQDTAWLQRMREARPLPTPQPDPAGTNHPVELLVANRFWGQRGHGWRSEYLEAIHTRYAASLQEIDFASPTDAAQQINRWVDEQTKGKIKALVAPSTLNQDMRLMLTNAIYFKGEWEKPFEATRREAFRLQAGTTVQTPMMDVTGSYRYAKDERVQVVELPYAGHPQESFSMVLIVPHTVNGLAKVEAALTPQYVEQLRSACASTWTQIIMPEFQMQQRLELASVLARMGMPHAFAARADFSGMSSQGGLAIADVVHQACVDVNVRGTQAAAATASRMMPLSLPPKPIIFRADRPFLFLIRENTSGTILFLGRVTDPR